MSAPIGGLAGHWPHSVLGDASPTRHRKVPTPKYDVALGITILVG